MKLGGLTFWRNNYGSILQAYALQMILNSYDGVDYEIICQYGKRILSADNMLDKIRTYGLFESLKRLFWKFCIPPMHRRTKCLQKFVDENLMVSGTRYSEDTISHSNSIYEGFVFGSDQIWNAESVDMNSMYWGGFVNQGKLKFAYAPSIGVTTLTEEQRDKIQKNLSDFTGISCREKSGADMLNCFLKNHECIHVLDPTMLIERAVWDKMSMGESDEPPYLFVYLLRGTKEWRQQIERFAKRKKLKILTMPFLDYEKIVYYDLIFGDERLWEVSPVDFIRLIRNASIVVTDSFHCMVFSCLYHVPFWVYPKIGKAQMSRIQELLSLLEISNRIISTDISDMDMRERINWENVDEVIERKRKESRAYLDGILMKGRSVHADSL